MLKLIVEARAILQTYLRLRSNIHIHKLSDLIIDAAKISEELTDKLRRLTLEVTVDQKKYERYKRDILSIHGIKIDYDEDRKMLSINLPLLIPHRKSSYTDFIYAPLNFAVKQWCMQRYKEGSTLPNYNKGTVSFIHIYNNTLPLERIRDHDNIEEKQVMDILANTFMTNDRGLNANTYHCTVLGEQDRTLIYIMNSNDFPLWLVGFSAKNGIENLT